jgi:phospholipid/cholesterol/gamma-HCH transport system permease protein
MSLDTARAAFRRPFQWREFIQQCWFAASVSIIPTCLTAIPFGAIIALQTGALIRQLGAVSLNGGASVIAVVREAGPIVTALIIAGAAGSAVCADLGARKIRDEIDAMEVLAVDPLHRLVVPRVLAIALVSVLLNGLVSVVGVAGGYFFSVVVQHGSPGPYFASFTELAQTSDIVQAEAKALVFGLIAGLMASYKGLNAKGGPKGVGDAVNESVVFTFMLLFATNFVASLLYQQIVPQKAL